MLLKLDVLRSPQRSMPAPVSWASPQGVRTLPWVVVAVLATGLATAWVGDRTPAMEPTPAAQRSKIVLAEAIDDAANAPIFGRAVAEKPALAPVLDIKLKGVFAGNGERTGAIVNTGGEDRFVELGREIGPSLRLAEVKPGHIVIDRAGVTQRIDLVRFESNNVRRGHTTAVASPPPQPLPENAAQPPPGATPPAQVMTPLPVAPPPPNTLPENAPPTAPPASMSSLDAGPRPT